MAVASSATWPHQANSPGRLKILRNCMGGYRVQSLLAEGAGCFKRCRKSACGARPGSISREADSFYDDWGHHFGNSPGLDVGLDA